MLPDKHGITSRFNPQNINYRDAIDKLNSIYSVLKLRADMECSVLSGVNYDCVDVIATILDEGNMELQAHKTAHIPMNQKKRWKFYSRVFKTFRIKELQQQLDLII